MAKKIVRGITDVKTINNQDYDTNNVNDLLSDGQYNYIHRKKGKIEEYHNLTDNIKTLSSDNTELLAVTNNNKTTNTATLHPKHDKQKEQVIESTRDTITINHGTNGTAEKTTVDVNFEKVQEKLTAGTGITIQGQTISATGAPLPVEGASVSIQDFSSPDYDAFKQVVTIGQQTLTTFTFQCVPGTREFVITEPLKSELVNFLPPTGKLSSGGITITGTPTDNDFEIKLVNSNYTAENVYQQATFTLYGGGGDVPGV